MNPQLPPPDEFRVAAGEDAVHDARHRIVNVAGSWGVPLSRAAFEDAKLCASEVITNALLYAGGECTVRTTWTGQHLKVEVIDRSLRLPVVLRSGEEIPSGRGLALVEAFAYSWGWEPKELGKIVFFLISADTAITGDHRLTTLIRTAQARLQDEDTDHAPAVESRAGELVGAS